jgi:hypothetical protein
MELTVVAKTRANELAMEEALRKKKQAEEMRARTIAYCEKLGERLEGLAITGKKPMVDFYCDRYYRPQAETNKDYADHRLSYRSIDGVLDMDYLTEWFKAYCFEVSITDVCMWHYGCGECKGFRVVIKPAPECIID